MSPVIDRRQAGSRSSRRAQIETEAAVHDTNGGVDVESNKGVAARGAVAHLRDVGRLGPAVTRVTVEVLGPVQVTGSASSLEHSPKLTELVVYLSLHAGGATPDALSAALWPDRRVPMTTFSNRLSEARMALGVASDGNAHLRKRNGRYLLSPEVTTDWERFDSLQARQGDVSAWRHALSLVRGRPFDGLREAQWTVLEGVVPAMEAAVVELACRVGRVLLEAGDGSGADASARRAILACPWDERLYRLLMRAADVSGNRSGIEAALRQLARVFDGEESDPLAVVHSTTANLYRELTSARRIPRAM